MVKRNTLKKWISTARISSWTNDLAAVEKQTPDFDHKKEYREYLLDKYSK